MASGWWRVRRKDGAGATDFDLGARPEKTQEPTCNIGMWGTRRHPRTYSENCERRKSAVLSECDSLSAGEAGVILNYSQRVCEGGWVCYI